MRLGFNYFLYHCVHPALSLEQCENTWTYPSHPSLWRGVRDIGATRRWRAKTLWGLRKMMGFRPPLSAPPKTHRPPQRRRRGLDVWPGWSLRNWPKVPPNAKSRLSLGAQLVILVIMLLYDVTYCSLHFFLFTYHDN